MIIHIDMDAFYASVEERENPALKGKPLIVGGYADARGVVAAANYAARHYGIQSAMPTSHALKLYPDLVVVPPRGACYAAESAKIHRIFMRYTPIVEPLSLDEAFLDPVGCEKLYGSSMAIAKKIKTDIKRELNLVASVGIGPNKFIAKLASGHEKPDGFTVVIADQIQTFLDPMKVERIWGIGKSAASKLHAIGVRTIFDLRSVDTNNLSSIFGRRGKKFHQLAHGQDDRPVTPQNEIKSVSHETTFARDITSIESLESTLMTLVEAVGFRLRASGLHGRTVQIKLRYANFKTITRSYTFDRAVCATRVIWQVAKGLLHAALLKQKFEIRLLGVEVSNFSTDTAQSDFFTKQENEISDPIDQLTDDIRLRFGKFALARGKSIKPQRQ